MCTSDFQSDGPVQRVTVVVVVVAAVVGTVRVISHRIKVIVISCVAASIVSGQVASYVVDVADGSNGGGRGQG